MNEYIAIIPARGGSERIKNKNLTKISGKSLLQMAIEAAKNANFFSRVIVNSEDPKIILEAGNLGIETYNRPIELASSSASVIDVVKAIKENIIKKISISLSCEYTSLKNITVSRVITNKVFIIPKFTKNEARNESVIGKISPVLNLLLIRSIVEVP